MNTQPIHTFHIPVMGLAFTIDTPLKVGRYGIHSVVSIVEEVLIEQMRKYHAEKNGIHYEPILDKDEDARARRTTGYLDLMQDLLDAQMKKMLSDGFQEHGEAHTYFELLPSASPLRAKYQEMLLTQDVKKKEALETELLNAIEPGRIDINIMAKADRLRYDQEGNGLIDEYSQALASLRGFAKSKLNSAVVLSAGYNPRLYNYLAEFSDFFPDENGKFKKQIILKVSDYRSALTQGKLLAKKGLWIAEYRVESGLNCGGHAFATDGLLLGPIMEEFKVNRKALQDELFDLFSNALVASGKKVPAQLPDLRVTVQGGVGTQDEHQFLLDYYNTQSVGWGSPFLLVPEATQVDTYTLNELSTATPDDYYLSHASPFGIPFNNFKKSSSQKQHLERIEKGRPGSPCYKKELASNTEFTKEPICTASREYQQKKIEQLKTLQLSEEEFNIQYALIVEKECLCEGLAAPIIDTYGITSKRNLSAVAICPGPNLAWFSGVFTLSQMVSHIYGRTSLLNAIRRPHMFINELNLYVKYLKDEPVDTTSAAGERKRRVFYENLLKGIAYYRALMPKLAQSIRFSADDFIQDLLEAEATLHHMMYTTEIA